MADLASDASSDDPLDAVLVAARAASTKTDEDTVVLDVGDVLSITGWFVITGGRNDRQVKAVVDEVEEHVAESCGLRPVRVEGLDTTAWVLVDYGSFVVHVLRDDARRYYDLERLWADVPRVAWS